MQTARRCQKTCESAAQLPHLRKLRFALQVTQLWKQTAVIGAEDCPTSIQLKFRKIKLVTIT